MREEHPFRGRVAVCLLTHLKKKLLHAALLPSDSLEGEPLPPLILEINAGGAPV